MGVNRKFCYTEGQCKFAEEVIRTLSKEMDGSENQWERGYNAGLQFAIKTLQRFKNNFILLQEWRADNDTGRSD